MLIKGSIYTNDDICKNFNVYSRGGIRVNKWNRKLVLISNYVNSTYKNFWEDNTLYFTGIGQVGRQKDYYYPNRYLRESKNNGFEIHLFEVMQKDEYTYRGKMELKSVPFIDSQPDKYGNVRDVIIYPLKPIDFSEPENYFNRIFFVHNIYEYDEQYNSQVLDYVADSAITHTVVLFPVNKYTFESEAIDMPSICPVLNTNHDLLNGLIEGDFATVWPEGEGIYSFRNVNGSAVAAQFIDASRNLRSELSLAYTKAKDHDFSGGRVHSYHVNVGHGNCSIVVYEKDNDINVWFIDCSTKRNPSAESCWGNIESCLTHISKKSNIKNIKIDKLFITHVHYDHISGFFNLLNKRYLDSNTEIWLNLHFAWNMPFYTRMLEVIKGYSFSLVEPIYNSSINAIKVIYPYSTLAEAPGNAVNNTSVVYKIELAGKTMILPGDIEAIGWNFYGKCYGCLKDADYYCISHHGSLNGHERNVCDVYKNHNNVSDCCKNNVITILMGQDGAYPGIYSEDVLRDFNDKGTKASSRRLHKTEISDENEVPKFIELCWATDKIKYYY